MSFEAITAIPDDHVFDFEEFMYTEVLKRRPDGEKLVDGLDETMGVCRFFLKGFCAKGSNCTYRHTTAGGGSADKSVVCKHWLRGLCKKGDLCEFLYFLLLPYIILL